MITGKLTPRDILQGAVKFFRMKAGHGLFSVNLEVTKRCNLRCAFCDYWREGGTEERLSDYAPLISRLAPLHLTITGGEPLLRRDLEGLIASIKARCGFVYMNCITNGSLLTVERATSLWRAGLTQLSVSCDFPDARHDENRGHPGLFAHLCTTLPAIARAGLDNLALNCVIMRENLEDLLPLARLAASWGWKISFSTYNARKNRHPGPRAPEDPGETDLPRLERAVADLIAWKREAGNVTNSEWYLRNVVRYFREGGIGGCLAGRKWVQVTPSGRIRRCSEREDLGPWETFSPRAVSPTACRECWYACRGEAEAPLGLSRIIEVNRKPRPPAAAPRRGPSP